MQPDTLEQAVRAVHYARSTARQAAKWFVPKSSCCRLDRATKYRQAHRAGSAVRQTKAGSMSSNRLHTCPVRYGHGKATRLLLGVQQ